MLTCANAVPLIPRISRDQRPTAAFGGAQLHMSGQGESARQSH
jgi:hypothetical protein